MKSNGLPGVYPQLTDLCARAGFTMPSDLEVGKLLCALCRSKPGGRFLELGTGVGLSLAWMIEGMDDTAACISLDNDEHLAEQVSQIITEDSVEILFADGDDWIRSYTGEPFDLIFADTWPGKYRLLEETLAMLAPGGLYVIDDMLPQPTWPEGHAEKAEGLRQRLLNHASVKTAELPFSTGVIIAASTPLYIELKAAA